MLRTCELHSDCVVVYDGRDCPLCEMEIDFAREQAAAEAASERAGSLERELEDARGEP